VHRRQRDLLEVSVAAKRRLPKRTRQSLVATPWINFT
jgi:hypothetical protein